MTPEEATVMMALSIADEQAEIRKEVEAMIRRVVQDELKLVFFGNDVTNQFKMAINNGVQENRWLIERMAMQALKAHFQNQNFQ